MLKYAFVVDDGSALGESRIIFQSEENDPPTRWHLFDIVRTENALLFVTALNEDEKKRHSI